MQGTVSMPLGLLDCRFEGGHVGLVQLVQALAGLEQNPTHCLGGCPDPTPFPKAQLLSSDREAFQIRAHGGSFQVTPEPGELVAKQVVICGPEPAADHEEDDKLCICFSSPRRFASGALAKACGSGQRRRNRRAGPIALFHTRRPLACRWAA